MFPFYIGSEYIIKKLIISKKCVKLDLCYFWELDEMCDSIYEHAEHIAIYYYNELKLF